MLRVCTACNANFAENMSRCPICQHEYVQTEQERHREQWAVLFRRMAHGEKKSYLKHWLEQDVGLSSEQSAAWMKFAEQQLRRVSRDRGLRLLCFGLLLWFIAFVSLAITGGIVIATGCVAIGFASIIVGTIKLLTGWNLADNLGGITAVSPLPDFEDSIKI